MAADGAPYHRSGDTMVSCVVANGSDAIVMSIGRRPLSDDLGLRDAGPSDQLESLRIDFWERKLIHEALKRTNGSIPDAAKLLGLGRATLYRKVEEYGIERK